jgi:hypothetical protein
MHYGNVSPVTLPLCSLMEHHQVAVDANTQSYENVRGPFDAITWWEMQIHRFMKTFEFNYRIRMWKCCILTMLCYMNCRWNQVWTMQNISVWKYCRFSRAATETIINVLISIQQNVIVINTIKSPCAERATVINVLFPVWGSWHTVSLTTLRHKKAHIFADIEEKYQTPDDKFEAQCTKR